MIDGDKEYYRVDEVAELFRVQVRAVYRWIIQGRIAHAHSPSGRIRIPACEVNKFIQSQESEVQMITNGHD